MRGSFDLNVKTLPNTQTLMRMDGIDTAKYAFKNFETFDALNSFYDEKFAENEIKQIKDLKNYIKNWNSEKNLVLITHFVVISSMLNTGSSSGEIIISDKNFNIIGSIDMM